MLTLIGKALGIPEAKQGTLVSAYSLAVGIFALIIGPISDKIGRRRGLLAGCGVMCVALALHCNAFDYASLLSLRALAGVGGGALSGAAVSYIGDYFSYARRGWASGWVMSSVAIGQILGVPISIVVAESYGFRAPFLLFALALASTFILIWKFIPQPNVELLSGKLTLRRGIDNYLSLFRRREVKASALTSFLIYASLALYVVYLPTWLVNEKGITIKQVASLFFVGGVANAITSPIAGRLSDQIGRKALIVLSCCGLAIVMLLTIFVIRNVWLAYPVFFITMVLVAARISPFQALISSLATGEKRGTLLSTTSALGQTGFAIGGAVAGPAYTRFGYLSNTLSGTLCVLLTALIAWRWLPEPKPDIKTEGSGDALLLEPSLKARI